MIRYRSRRPPDTELRARLHQLANQRRRFGYRRLYILLRDEGAPRAARLLTPRQRAYQRPRLQLPLDETSMAGHQR
jgi:hypothetical protein